MACPAHHDTLQAAPPRACHAGHHWTLRAIPNPYSLISIPRHVRAAFAHSWSLTLVLLGLAPVIGTAGYLVSMATARLSTRAADAYAEAAAVVAEALASIRTVLALCGAPAIVQNYAAVCLDLARNPYTLLAEERALASSA